MLIEKIETSIYIPVNCLHYKEMFILVHPRKSISDFQDDKKDYKECVNIFNEDIAGMYTGFDIEQTLSEFWTNRGYSIIYNNDAGVIKFDNHS